VFRIGGDEFAAILPECPLPGGQQCLVRLNAAFASIRLPQMPEPVGISLGLAIFDPAEPVAMDVLIRKADSEMYQAKRGLTTAH